MKRILFASMMALTMTGTALAGGSDRAEYLTKQTYKAPTKAPTGMKRGAVGYPDTVYRQRPRSINDIGPYAEKHPRGGLIAKEQVPGILLIILIGLLL
ncbi:hypothetical protein [Mesorhizobium sp. WSM2239]|uniref:Uncharacterized protein n=2 Tax=unclassified Mesorhizobium TaxID=325217 RepID=A0AAU8DG83_9HYPH